MDKQVRRTLKPGAIFTQRITQYPTVPEQRIDLLRNWVISSEKSWFKKIYDGGDAFARWSDMGKICGLQPDEVSRALDELTYYAKLHNVSTNSNVRLSHVKHVWFGDATKTSSIFAQVAEGLEEGEMSATAKGYHVVGFVDPLLYPLDYSCVYRFREPTRTPEEALTAPIYKFPKHSIHALRSSLGKRIHLPVELNEWTVSKRYSMLPTDFYINKEGEAHATSYINNLHPVKHREMYRLIANILTTFVPVLEQSLTDVLHPACTIPVNEPSEWYTHDGECPGPYEVDRLDKDGYGWSKKQERKRIMANNAYERWERTKTWVGPKPRPFIAPSRPISPYTLCDRKLQAVVQMDNIVVYPGSNNATTEWKVQGMANERIIATGVYFYSIENVAPGASISFREATCGSFSDRYNFDLEVLSKAYGVEIDPLAAKAGQLTVTKGLGVLDIQHGQCVVFPNTYQSRFLNMKPKDKSKPGVCKMLQFLFMDPATQVPSSAIIPPRQQGWRNGTAIQPISPEDAKAVRNQMLGERNVCNHIASERLFEPWILGLGSQ
ncbi:hypothetical protein IW140_006262 [Coemansia sp. RSA 1813]|nr:hypothetical protein EV178_006174 [Coemansia sp. RSA 1646]KAJ1765754.1 hypothetical protein LPJ74_006221 [Coemansia sp. RSA 1843]KAJ2085749.1 hypothetical protein IW138_006144 [Coemansia sp. RSA 986]KAJ2211891.1 hypothetical protein EV179_005126 [Coemansia sp. RSA 487]KAJ2562959.1 hypothetical protein IW140_006262 [Coemansia sp. RSA 1813]